MHVDALTSLLFLTITYPVLESLCAESPGAIFREILDREKILRAFTKKKRRKDVACGHESSEHIQNLSIS